MNPLHVNYVPKLLKSRQKIALMTFLKRLQTHYVVVLWCIVALDMNTCHNTPYIVFGLSFVSSVQYVYYSYNDFIYDLLYVIEKKPEIILMNKVSLWLRDFFIQFLCSLLTFWWIDDIHTCVPLDRIHQSYVWIALVCVTLVLHLINYKYVQSRSEIIVREAYDHVSQEVC